MPTPRADLDRLHCPHCEYDLTGLDDVSICPECGRPITADDRRHQVRRQIFLEMTRFAPWWHAAALILVGLVGYGWPLIFYLPGLIVAAVWFSGQGASQRRLLRRMWLLNLWLLQLPWAIPVLTYRITEWWVWNWGWGSWIAGAWEYEGGFKTWFIVVPASAAAAVAIPLWQWRWRRLVGIGGATCAAADLKHLGLRIALRITLWPVLLPTLMMLVFAGLILLLDTLLGPRWWF